MGQDRRDSLGHFLRTRRARIQPADVGLGDFGGTRRVPGLRREELAMLAGVSVDHYVRLEQGRSVHFSESVLDAVARVLRLDEVERRHLYNLARGEDTPCTAPAPDYDPVADRPAVRPGLLRLLDSVGRVPAYVVGPTLDVLAWNAPAAVVFADFGALPVAERNWGRLVFLHEEVRERYVDWQKKAEDVVAVLRLQAGLQPHEPGLCTLLDELKARSPEFTELWAAHEVQEKTHGTLGLRHPVVGEFELDYETMRLPADPEQALVMYTAEAGSPSQDALRLLLAASERGIGVGG